MTATAVPLPWQPAKRQSPVGAGFGSQGRSDSSIISLRWRMASRRSGSPIRFTYSCGSLAWSYSSALSSVHCSSRRSIQRTKRNRSGGALRERRCHEEHPRRVRMHSHASVLHAGNGCRADERPARMRGAPRAAFECWSARPDSNYHRDRALRRAESRGLEPRATRPAQRTP